MPREMIDIYKGVLNEEAAPIVGNLITSQQQLLKLVKRAVGHILTAVNRPVLVIVQ